MISAKMKSVNRASAEVSAWISKRTGDTAFQPDAQELADWLDYAHRQPGMDPLLLPRWVGRLLLRDSALAALFDAISTLTETQRHLIFFSARNHDPALIAESIAGITAADYWPALETAGMQLRNRGCEPDNEVVLRLGKELETILEDWIQFSEEWEDEEARHKKRKQTLRLILISAGVMVLAWVFIVPLVFSLNGPDFFDANHDQLMLAVSGLQEESALAAQIMLRVEEQGFESLLPVLEDELLLMDQVDPEWIALYAGLLIRENRFKEARTLIRREKHNLNPELLRIFKGISWKSRFLP